MSSEETFFNERGVVVTNARFIADGRTFAMAQVSSVRAASDPLFRLSWMIPAFFGGILAGIGGLMLLGSLVGNGASDGVACSLVIAAPGVLSLMIAVFVFLNREHYVVVATSGGDVNALASSDMDRISRIVTAVNSALVHRG